jgi:hypothetical protein
MTCWQKTGARSEQFRNLGPTGKTKCPPFSRESEEVR